jgi:protein-S-isoprenylcysteine O-methyltransferase Ste14
VRPAPAPAERRKEDNLPRLTLFLKNLVFAVAVPGTVGVLVPYLLLRSALPQLQVELGAARLLGLLPAAAGVLGYLWCVWDFMAARGTPAPLDAPKELVVSGLYRYVRNPMYVSMLLFILGQALLYETGLLLLYGLALFVLFHAFVVAYEEPALERQFGESYRRYRRQAGRWLPRLPLRARA